MDEILRLLTDERVRHPLQLGSLVLARLLPIFVFTPVIGGQAVPTGFRFTVSVALAAGFTPALLAQHPTPVPGAPPYPLLLAKEALVGGTLAMYLLVLFEAVSAAGSAIDAARGAQTGMLLDPLSQQQESVLGAFFKQLGLVLFLTLGAHRATFEALTDSFVRIPPDAFLPPDWIGMPAATRILSLVQDFFVVAIRLASPVIVVILLLDLCLGLVNRVSPQIQVFFLSLTVKGTLGLLVLFATLGLLFDQFQVEIGRLLRMVQRMM